MSHLEKLKDLLKNKPEVYPNKGVRIQLGPRPEKTMIVAEKDDGRRAQEILEKIKQKKISGVVRKFPEVQPIEKEKEQKPEKIKPKVTKTLKKTLLLNDDEKELDEDMIEENTRDEVPIKNPIKRRTTKKPIEGVIELGPRDLIQIGDIPLHKRLPPPQNPKVKVSSYYMNNREIFVNFINGLFEPYKDDLMDETKGISCDDISKDSGEMSLLTHQKIVRDYINLYTPYRGLLLYHGLGSGKTCSSIAIAEGMKSSKQIIIMTPASLKRNYIEEIKKCGDLLYRKNQYWEWISITDNPNYINTLSSTLGLTKEYIQRNRGAWLVNITKPPNYKDLSSSDKKTLNDQLDEMIYHKYTFINYNGLRRDKFRQLTNNFDTNIFDNAVVIIDEAHNLISRIVNKINKISKFAEKKRGPGALLPSSLALLLYEFLLNADNCRIVLLTGTPIINYPNEIGILFNLLRGYIKTWSFTLSTDSNKKISKDLLQQYFAKERLLDYIDYSSGLKTLTVTRNPYGFESKITEMSGYKGVTNEKKEQRDSNGNIVYNERGQLSDADFIQRIVKILRNNDIRAVPNGTNYTVNTALPDTLDEFVNSFINKDTGNIINVEKFKRRIMGLTSYFRSAQEELLPVYDKHFNRHEVYVSMSDYQFKKYEEYRIEERLTEKSQNKSTGINTNELFKENSSTYRIFSRLACNFVMPTPPGRPNPSQYRVNLKDAKKQDELKEIDEHKKLDEIQEPNKIQEPDELNPIMQKEKEKQEKAQAKAIKEREKLEKAEAKAQKEREKEEKERLKAEAKAQKEREKMEKEKEKEEKERLKAEAKAQKEREKMEKVKEKEEKERLKAEAKAQKERDKIKVLRGGDDDDYDTNADVDTDTDADVDTDNEYMDGGGEGDENIADEFIDKNVDVQIQLDGYKDEDAALREADELEGDELLDQLGNNEYKDAIKNAMQYLEAHSSEFLTSEGLKIYGPKYLSMLENIDDPEHQGLHLIYSQFRSMEGIGIFCMVLEANGYAKLKIKRTINGWELNMTSEDMGKPCYALYTGTEDAEEREILRNIYNGTWDYIPNNIATQLRAKSNNNNLGEIVKILMITSAGSEGINLRNTRYVHIMEPYWHPVRTEQVIGRARRICSHQGLPKNLQTVDVFIYIMTFTQEQLNSEFAKELKLKDVSKYKPYLPQSSDQKLYEISNIKEQLSSQLLKAIKETSIDCATHIQSSTKEGLVCLSFGQPSTKDYSFNPDYTKDENDTIMGLNRQMNTRKFKEIIVGTTGKKYMLRIDTNQVYDYDSVIQAQETPGINPILLGKLVETNKGYKIIKEKT